MLKFNVFFRKQNGQIVEVSDQFDEEQACKEFQKDIPLSTFELYCFKVGEIAGSEFFKDAELIASSFGPLNI